MTDNFNVSLLTTGEASSLQNGFDKYMEICKPSDFATVLGAFSDNCNNCRYWCKDTKPDHYRVAKAFCINHYGQCRTHSMYDTEVAIRPVLKYSEVFPYIDKIFIDDNGESACLFGEYPQMLTLSNISRDLEKLYQAGKLIPSGKVYTTDSPLYDTDGNLVGYHEFIPYQHIEYVFHSNKYIRVTDFHLFNNEDKRNLELEDVFWIHVAPIEWIIDRRNDCIVARNALISGILYHYIGHSTRDISGNFEETDIYKYLNTYFKYEIIPKHLYKTSYNHENEKYNDTISKKFK